MTGSEIFDRVRTAHLASDREAVESVVRSPIFIFFVAYRAVFGCTLHKSFHTVRRTFCCLLSFHSLMYHWMIQFSLASLDGGAGVESTFTCNWQWRCINAGMPIRILCLLWVMCGGQFVNVDIY